MVFNKQSSSVTGHNGVIHLPRASEALDYEAEMAFVIETTLMFLKMKRHLRLQEHHLQRRQC